MLKNFIDDNILEEKITVACIVSDSYVRQYTDIHKNE